MSRGYPFCEAIDLLVAGRISAADAQRQERTARDILSRFTQQPGVVLADEVGMGKTFVALAVAVSVALADRENRPVVVMVPSSLRDKWPKDFALFKERCLPADVAARLDVGRADRPVEFLKQLDDPSHRRREIIFVTHGAMSRALFDKWTKLALIARAIKGRHGVDSTRRLLARTLPDILRWKSAAGRWPESLWLKLLTTEPQQWLAVLQRHAVAPDDGDDPVPRAVVEALATFDLTPVADALSLLPQRRSQTFEARLQQARRQIDSSLATLWPQVLRSLNLSLPLLILDEAHHLKNADTQLASLFRAAESRDDADLVTKGPLGHVFERMLFLTATPFQLGHAELCAVLERFDGIRWHSAQAPALARPAFTRAIAALRESLDAAQLAALRLERAWADLSNEDLVVEGRRYADAAAWWQTARRMPAGHADAFTEPARQVMGRYAETASRMATASEALRPWVVRHLKAKALPGATDAGASVARRRRLVGEAIVDPQGNGDGRGLAVRGAAVLPFLLAARATTSAPESRPVFAEGLASSYEAFLRTRRALASDAVAIVDSDDEAVDRRPVADAERWYLEHLERAVRRLDRAEALSHPKVSATVRKVVDLWRGGEKVLVFCHYIVTGRVLRQRISEAISQEILRMGAEQLGLPESEAADEMARKGARFFDVDSPIRRAADEQVGALVAQFTALTPYRDQLIEIVRRYLRTPSLLVRYRLLASDQLDADALAAALAARDASGMALRDVLTDYCHFLAERCSDSERAAYLEALAQLQTGAHQGREVGQTFSSDEIGDERAETLVPNVRLVNGITRHETRQRLMLTFNTPFYPEVLLSSNVLAEGVDLHLNCRHVIHHDLAWNPSTLEQRTGRIDRIGAKCERSGQPVQVYLPYIAETQDEKMYRVVSDRERWFSVVMGEKFETDARTTESLASRVPFPEEAADGLTFTLHVVEAPG